MSTIAGLSVGLNTGVVQEGLDAVFYENFDKQYGPQMATVRDNSIFNQYDVIGRNSVTFESYAGIGLWTERAERQDLAEVTPVTGNPSTFIPVEYAAVLPISRWFMEDDMEGVVAHSMRDFAATARATQESKGMGLFRNGFGSTLTEDGSAWFSNSHTTLGGFAVDNLLTEILTEQSLYTAMVMLAEQKNQGGVIMGKQAATLLVPPALFKTAMEIVGSPLRSGTADNDMNVIGEKYPIRVVQSNYLGAAAGGSDTAWFLLAETHQAFRFIRESVATTLVSWETQSNNDFLYKGYFRETYGVKTYEGAIGSTGLTA